MNSVRCSILSFLPNDILKLIVNEWVSDLTNFDSSVCNRELREKFLECVHYSSAYQVRVRQNIALFQRWRHSRNIKVQELTIVFAAETINYLVDKFPDLNALSIHCTHSDSPVDLFWILTKFPHLEKVEIISNCSLRLHINPRQEITFPLKSLHLNGVDIFQQIETTDLDNFQFKSTLLLISKTCPALNKVHIHNCPQFVPTTLNSFLRLLPNIFSLEYRPHDSRSRIIRDDQNLLPLPQIENDPTTIKLIEPTNTMEEVDLVSLEELHLISASQDILFDVYFILSPTLRVISLCGCIFPTWSAEHDELLTKCYTVIQNNWQYVRRLELHSCPHFTDIFFSIICNTCSQLSWLELDGCITRTNTIPYPYQLITSKLMNLKTLIISNCFFLTDEDVVRLCQGPVCALDRLEVKFCKKLTVVAYEQLLLHFTCTNLIFRAEYTTVDTHLPIYFIRRLIPYSSFCNSFSSLDWIDSFFHKRQPYETQHVPRKRSHESQLLQDKNESQEVESNAEEDSDDFTNFITVNLFSWNSDRGLRTGCAVETSKTLYWNGRPISPFSMDYIRTATVQTDVDNMLSLK